MVFIFLIVFDNLRRKTIRFFKKLLKFLRMNIQNKLKCTLGF